MLDLASILPTTKPLKILVVEDFDELRLSIQEMLGKIFGKVVTASNGQEALELYKKEHQITQNYFDIVLSDIQMPKMNGIALTEAIYAINPKQSIVILSAYQDVEYLMAFVNLGIERFLTKPIKHDNFIDVLYSIAKKITHYDQTPTGQSMTYFGNGGAYDAQHGHFYNGKTRVHLTKNESIFMQLLLEQPGKIYNNEDIEVTFGKEDIEISNDSVRSLLSKLRKKLAENSIESIYSFGYRLNVTY
ncbi:MAG: hypothetical protein KU37_09145 [Sulfuricurvum sp. PC08-66]|nr:MAG: hypothetical protein KU37_09145 [Sulfuricurvum sp. PC08-66]